MLGTTYGGDGRSTFALPDLRARIPYHTGDGLTPGQSGGSDAHTLTISEMPAHSHSVTGGASPADSGNPANNFFGGGGQSVFAATPNAAMSPNCVTSAGGSQPHTNSPPSLVLSFCIALQGIFPSRN